MISRPSKLVIAVMCTLAAAWAHAGLTEQQLAWHWDPATRDQAREATLAVAIWLEDESANRDQWQDRVEVHRLALSNAFERVPPDQAALTDGLFGWLMQSRDPDLDSDRLDQMLPRLDDLGSLLRPQAQAGRLARVHQLMAFEAPLIWDRLRERLSEPEVVEAPPEIDESAEDVSVSETEEELPPPLDIDEQIDAFWDALMRPPPPPVEVLIDHPETELARQEAEALQSGSEEINEEPGSETMIEPEGSESVAESTQEPDLAPEPELEPMPEPSDVAWAQAARVFAWRANEDAAAARLELLAILQAELESDWRDGRQLRAVWESQRLLAEIAVLEAPQEPAAALRSVLSTFSEDPARDLRLIDTDLPVVLALLEDAAIELENTPADPLAAMVLLGDAYARLGLFVGNAEFYLDQPVRDEVRMAMAACAVDPELVGPLPRAVFEDCLELLVSQMDDSLGVVELVGDGSGPFSDLFLRREMGLVSWQRVAYLDGHLNWLLGASCSPPEWQNPLEWSLLAHYLSRWVAQRPGLVVSPRWRDAVDAFERQTAAQREASTLFIDCLAGLGSERLDPVLRLISRHSRALDELSEALQTAEAEFYAEVTRPQADIDLDSDAAQLTSYRPEGLTIGPCSETNVCGVRAELSVSRALLGEFPNAFLLADQLRIGQLDLCYQDVRWEERQSRSARSNDPRVANYDGFLSFDLLGTFEREGQTDVVFRQRLRAAESRHYLFASSDPEVLAMDCPNALAGQPISSQLAEDHLGLVPDRLTYFVSLPTTPEAELQANWDQGAEWRDWFVTGDRVDKVIVSDGALLAIEVEAELDRRARQRERELASRLLSPLSPAQISPDAVTIAMARVAENAALIRRVLEIHYPRVIRHDQTIRALLTGEAGLLNRDRVRQLSDEGIGLAQSAILGRARLDSLRDYWQSLPMDLRELGQTAPELDFAAERLDELRRLSRSWLSRDVSSPDP
ncbi:MAG: hypothetical protein AAGJ52_00140 [Pseudomonadota bacterium]